MKKTRRDFLKSAAAGGALLLSPLGAMANETDLKADDEAVGMLYDSTLCVGCKACVTRCKQVNDMEAAPSPNDGDRLWDSPNDLDYRTRNIIKLYKEEDQFAYVKHQCMHCIKPSCVSACPVSAMQKEEKRGIVFYDKDKCIGCRYCQIACPFNIPKFEWPEAFPKIVKCDLCKYTNLKLKNEPACCETCPTEAVIYGKRKDLLHEAKMRMAAHPEKYQDAIYGEHEVGGTNVIYLAGTSFTNLGFPELEQESAAVVSEHIQHTIYKGFIAPVALYGFLAMVALKNRKTPKEIEHEHGIDQEIKEELKKKDEGEE